MTQEGDKGPLFPCLAIPLWYRDDLWDHCALYCLWYGQSLWHSQVARLALHQSCVQSERFKCEDCF